MKDKKSLLYDARVQAGILAAVAVIFLVLIFFAKENMVLMAIWISLCASAFIISCWLLVSGLRDKAAYFNFFLYDRNRKKSIAEKDLTFEFVNDNLTQYLSDFSCRSSPPSAPLLRSVCFMSFLCFLPMRSLLVLMQLRQALLPPFAVC